MARLPVKFRDMFKNLQEIRDSLGEDAVVGLLGPRGAGKDLLARLVKLGAEERGKVFTWDTEGAEPPEEIAENLQADLIVLVLSAAEPLPDTIGDLIATISQARRPFVVALTHIDRNAQHRELAHDLAVLAGRTSDRVASIDTRHGEGLRDFLDLCVRGTDGRELALAATFPIFRKAVARLITARTAKQNMVIGTVTFLPGSDMPALTANQAKMVLEIAAAYGQEITADRVRELLAVVGGGYGMRSAARQLLTLLPGPGWLVKGGVAYGGTVAIGRLAAEYFERISPERELALGE